MSSLSQFLSGNILSKAQAFTATGTWTQPVGVTGVQVLLVGGGGGAGGIQSGGIYIYAGSGGGGCTVFAQTAVTGNVTVTVGAGGLGSTNAAGGVGGTSIFGTLLYSFGGGGGGYSYTNPYYYGNGGGGGGLVTEGETGDSQSTTGPGGGHGGGWRGDQMTTRGGPKSNTAITNYTLACGRSGGFWVGGGGGVCCADSTYIPGSGLRGGWQLREGGGSYQQGAHYTDASYIAGYGGGGAPSGTDATRRNGGSGYCVVFWNE